MNYESPWISGPLGKYMPLQRGFDLPLTKIQHGNVPVIYSNGVGRFHSTAMVSGPGVVTGRSGTIGNVHYVEGDYWPHNTALWVTDFKYTDPKFVYYFLQSLGLHRFTSGSGVPTLNRNDAHSFTISIPESREEQRLIASALSDADRSIASLERLIAKKQAIKQGMMQQLLTGRTRLPGFTDPWSEACLGNHVTYVKTAALSRAQLDMNSSLKYLHYGDIHTRTSVFLNAEAEEMPRVETRLAGDAGMLNCGDLIFADASEDPAGVGKSVEILGTPDTGVIAGLHTIASRFDKSVLADGFKAYLQFIPNFRDQLLRLAAGTKVLATTRSYISSITLMLPEVVEQKAIAKVLRDSELEIEALQVRLTKARAIKTGMMQQLLTGRTRLPVEETS